MDDIMDLTVQKSGINRPRIGARNDRSTPGALGYELTDSRATTDAAMVACVTQAAEKFSAMSDAYRGRDFRLNFSFPYKEK